MRALGRGLTAVFGLGILLGAAGCSSESPSNQELETREVLPKIPVPVLSSPSGGVEFDFCPSAANSGDVNLTNAAWMSFFAANEYAEPGALAPTLTALGFHAPGVPKDKSWAECAADLQQMKAWEAEYADELSDIKIPRDRMNPQAAEKMRAFVVQHADSSALGVSTEEGIEGFGPCARKWLHGSTAGYPNFMGYDYPAAAFEHYIYNTDPDAINSHVQFYSDGRIREDGAAYIQGSTQAFIARHSVLPVAIVSFRGTQPDRIADLLADANVVKSDLADFDFEQGWGSAHSGFLNNVASVSEKVSGGSRRSVLLLRQLERWSADGLTIWVTGHSLGAALGTLLTARMLDLNAKDIASGDAPRFRLGGLYTSGSPRVGDDTFAMRFTEAAQGARLPVVRFRNGDDIVTDIPGLLSIIDDATTKFRHVGRFMHLREANIGDGSLHVGEWGEDPEDFLIKSLANHDSAGYDAEGNAISGYYRQLQDQRLSGAHAAIDGCP